MYNQQLDHTEDLIGGLDDDLQETNRQTRQGQLPLPQQPDQSTQRLNDAARLVSSTLNQLVSATQSADKQHVGASSVDVAHALRGFVSNVREIAPITGPSVDK